MEQLRQFARVHQARLLEGPDLFYDFKRSLASFRLLGKKMLETREPIEFDHNSLDLGYRNCRAIVKRQLKPHIWHASNIAGENRRGVEALLAHLVSTLDMLDLESSNGLSLDVWQEIRGNLSDAFLEKYASVELAALVDTCRRFNVPKQFVFDPLRGADLWIRSRKFETYEELETFCSYVGGATMAALVPVVGYVDDDYELAAIDCGKAIMLTQILANCVFDMKRNCVFIAQEDLKSCEVDIPRLKLRRPTESFRHLIRLYVSRLEPLYHKAGKLLAYLDFDGRRSLTSLLATNWKTMVNLQRDPDLALSLTGALTAKELLGLRTKHMLGMATKLSFIPEDHGHH